MTHNDREDVFAGTFADAWARACAARAGHPFLVFEGPDGDVASWTYEDFDRVLDRMVTLLRQHGAAHGSAVHLALTNSPTFIAVWLAATKLGAWIVPSDPAATAPELEEHLRRTTPTVGFCASARADRYAAATAAATAPAAVVEIDEADVALDWLPSTGNDHDAGTAIRPPSPGDRAAVMFTSGTTGRPKGVEVTQANYAFAGDVMAAAAGLGPDDRQLVVLPLFHANAQYYSFASAIAVGASVALMHTFSASGFVEQASRHSATHASLFAGPMRMILARGGPPDHGRVPLRHCWFAQNVASDQYETLATWFGCRPRQLYGMTETLPAVLTDRAGEPTPDTMGYVTPGCTVELYDDAGRPCPPGDEGEIVVGGLAGRTIFSGYLDDPVTTAASFRDGWFRTGDRATRDADGRFRFAGRHSDLLKVSGENVSVVEVEAVLARHPRVLEAAVVGAPDPIRDEVPVAFVVLRDDVRGAAGDAGDVAASLGAWCAARLAKAKRPARYELVDALPRTSVGKVRTYVLRRCAEGHTLSSVDDGRAGPSRGRL